MAHLIMLAGLKEKSALQYLPACNSNPSAHRKERKNREACMERIERLARRSEILTKNQIIHSAKSVNDFGNGFADVLLG